MSEDASSFSPDSSSQRQSSDSSVAVSSESNSQVPVDHAPEVTVPKRVVRKQYKQTDQHFPDLLSLDHVLSNRQQAAGAGQGAPGQEVVPQQPANDQENLPPGEQADGYCSVCATCDLQSSQGNIDFKVPCMQPVDAPMSTSHVVRTWDQVSRCAPRCATVEQLTQCYTNQADSCCTLQRWRASICRGGRPREPVKSKCLEHIRQQCAFAKAMECFGRS